LPADAGKLRLVIAKPPADPVEWLTLRSGELGLVGLEDVEKFGERLA